MTGSWRRLNLERLQHCRVFDVDRVRYARPDGRGEETFFVIDAPDWVNVIPLAPEGDVLFVRQFRFGIDLETLEIPGGMCDTGESPLDAARRELCEETGYEAGELIELGAVHPNPALQSNRCHTFLARDLRRAGEPRPDPHEDLELVRVPLARVPELIASGAITHALVVAAFHLLSLK